MNDVYADISNYNKKRENKVLIVFDNMIADIEYNKNFTKMIKELFYRGRKMNISIVFITHVQNLSFFLWVKLLIKD